MSDMEPQLKDDLLLEYLAGTVGPGDIGEFERGHGASGIETLRHYAAEARQKTPREIEPAWDYISARLREVNTRPIDSRPRKMAALWIGTAAAVIAVATFGYQSLEGYVQKRQAPAPKIYTTLAGERVSVTLSDGTQALLAPASTLAVNGRAVSLKGQALFTAAHKNDSPFTVVAGNTKTVVLGTTFSVRAYEDENDIRIVVRDGRVSVNEKTILSERDAVTVDSKGNAHLSSGVAVKDEMAWTEGRLIFENAPVPTVIAELRRAYGADIRVGSESINRRSVSGVFEIKNAINVSLESICLTLGIKVARAGNDYILQEK